MAITPNTKNTIRVLENFRSNLTTRTGINNFDNLSKAKAVTDVLTNEIMTLRQDIAAAFKALQYGVATGKDLVYLGRQINMLPFDISKASVLASESSVAFYVSSGTFGDINAAADIVVPAGTQIFSVESANDSGNKIVYQTIETVTLFADQSLQYVAAEATVFGKVGNVNRGVLRTHSFTGIASPNLLKVVNFFPILNGEDEESEESYRYRLVKHFETLLSVNKANIELSSLNVPGVKNLSIQPGYFGIGTMVAVPLGLEKQVNDRMITGVQQQLNSIRPPGALFQAIEPISVVFDFVFKVKSVDKLSTLDKQNIKNQIYSSILNYFRFQSLGGVVDLISLKTALLLVFNSKRLKSDQANLFDKVWVTRSYGLSENTAKDLFLNNVYQLQPIEYGTLGTVEVEYIN